MDEAAARGLFEQAIDLPSDERAAFLESACGGDPALRQDVEALLAADARAATETFWFRSALHNQVVADGNARPAIGDTVGRYRLVELIGRGGMGAVYRAERIDAEFEQCVAVKLIDGLFNSADVVGNFRAERQILAHLDHPNIARLIDGGTGADGLPYLVMEFVRGVSPAEYCRQGALTIAQRLALFLQICAAVQFAHQRMVVHRDLKPGNILVTEDGTPKLLDFGVAKIIGPNPSFAAGPQTVRGMAPLTARYASPEQIRGEPITTASDIYSLGVILYELLCGQSPYGDADRPIHEIMRAVCDEDPRRPSSFAPKLPSDLDNIVLRAMRKAPSERYASAGQFADDVRRYLEGRPVEARGDAPLYVATKFIRRNWAISSVAALLLCSLIGGLVLVNAARTRADRRFAEERRLVHSVLFDYSDAINRLPGALPVRQRMVKGALVYLDRLSREADSPELERDIVTGYAQIADLEGNEYQVNLGDTATALASARKAAREADRLLTKDHSLATLEAAARAFATDGSVLYSAGDLAQADIAYQRSLRLREDIARTFPQDLDNLTALAEDLQHLGDLYGAIGYPNLGKPRESLIYYNRAKALVARLTARHPDDLSVARERYETLIAVSDPEEAFGGQQTAMRDLVDARALIGKVLAVHPNDTDVIFELANVESRIGKLMVQMGEPAAAVVHLRHSLALLVRLHAADPASATFRRGESIAENGLADALRGAGDPSSAVEHNEKAVALAQSLSHDSPDSAQYRMDLGNDERQLAEGLLAEGDGAAALLHAERAVVVLCASHSFPGAAPNTPDCSRGKRAVSEARAVSLRTSH